MRSALSTAILGSILLVLVSCASDDQEVALSDEFIVPEYEISIVDSFGLELGDSLNMIVSINVL